MSLNLDQFQDSFFEESFEHVGTMEDSLLRLEQQPGDLELLNRIFRAAHSIKGAGSMFGFTDVSEFTHKMENLLDALRNNRMAVTKPIIDLLLGATDGVKGLLEAARENRAPDETVVGPLRERLQACVSGSEPTAPAVISRAAPADGACRRRFAIAWTPAPTVFQHGSDPLQIVRDLEGCGTLATTLNGLDALPPLDTLNPEHCCLSWTFSLETDRSRQDVESVFEFVREGSELTIAEEQAATRPAELPAEDSDHKPIGQILVEDGVVSPEGLAEALAQQKLLGEILVEKKLVSPQQLASALDKQHQQDASAHARKAETTSIRVDTEKIDKLINLVGELVITQSMLSDLGAHFEMGHLPVLLERIAQLERNTREIQERVMSVRMLPIGTAFNRFPRLVRDLAAKNGKKIHLVLSGEETELDKTVIESIGDPLTHLIRNSADHGLELPEERLDNNKPEMGTIKLNAYHEGGNICITVEDDGRGLNREKIHAKAVAQGLIAEGEPLTDDQVWSLIFRPGFSTADKITDVSGRGVGMDVVKRNLEGLGGTVSIRTTPGQGTTFTLKLPLTMAIIDGLSVSVGRETYIVPLTAINKSIQPAREEIKTVVGKGQLVRVLNDYIPVVRLHEVFSVPGGITDPTKGILMILESEGDRVAVLVDELLGQQQVVIKSMEQNFRKVDGVAGATIMGNGTVAFILDVRGLIALAQRGVPVAA